MVEVGLLLGYFSNILRILLLLPLLKWYKPILNKLKIKWVILAIIGSLAIYILGLFIWEGANNEKSIFDKILFTLILSPIIEEILYRYLMLGIILKKNFERINFHDFLMFIYIGTVLLIPDNLLYIIKWIPNKPDFSLFVFILSIPILIFLLNKLKLLHKLSNFLNYYSIVIVAMAFLLSHNVFASQSQFVGGLFFGFLYYKSRNILPPIIGHFVYNLSIFIGSMNL